VPGLSSTGCAEGHQSRQRQEGVCRGRSRLPRGVGEAINILVGGLTPVVQRVMSAALPRALRGPSCFAERTLQAVDGRVSTAVVTSR